MAPPASRAVAAAPLAKELEAYRDLGIEDLTVWLPTEPRDESLQFLDELHAEVAKLGLAHAGHAMSQNRGLRYELLPDAKKYRLCQAKELLRKARYVECDWSPLTAQQSAATHGCPGQ